MLNKNFFLCSALFFFSLSVGVICYGSMSVAKRAAMVTMQARFKFAEGAFSSGRRHEATTTYRAATIEYQKWITKPGYYIGMGDDFLTAGNGFWQQGQFRAALAAYLLGLEHDPNSLNLLTSAGFCALRLGELELARDFFERSHKLYAEDERVKKALHNLKKQQ
ncbi:MAG: hypothetical protein JXR80_00935 [Deltaproteobacteria bacterium]|nr:hypothetical protein [Deltaproteobacteria bacterium]